VFTKQLCDLLRVTSSECCGKKTGPEGMMPQKLEKKVAAITGGNSKAVCLRGRFCLHHRPAAGGTRSGCEAIGTERKSHPE
jgi:hypothetical protein